MNPRPCAPRSVKSAVSSTSATTRGRTWCDSNLAAGGLGPLIGDGRLPHYALENVVETYYDAEVFKGVHLGVDYQFVSNPGYNPDRGPIHILSGRLHFEF